MSKYFEVRIFEVPRRSPAVLISLAALMIGLIGALLAPATASAVSPNHFSVKAKPNLTPNFSRGTKRYVLPCHDGRVRMRVRTGADRVASVDGRGFASGLQVRRIALKEGQAIKVITKRTGGRTNRRVYLARCTPEALPASEFTFVGGARPRQMVTALGDYAVIFNDNGIPVWWFEDTIGVRDVSALSNGNLVWVTSGSLGAFGDDPDAAYNIRTLRGKILRSLRPPVANTDPHDVLVLPNGNAMVMAYVERDGVDLSPHGGEADATVLDALIQEIDGNGAVVWEWNSKDHIALDEAERWYPALGTPYDIVHINSMELDDDQLIISLRHTDAVYSIDRGSGEILWKLGGTATPESLTVSGDPLGAYPFNGQHDARIKNGRLTVFDNGTEPGCRGGSECGRPPRAVRYRLNETAKTARMIESVADPAVESAFCCGSARRYGGGKWVVTWGGTPDLPDIPGVTGFRPDGTIGWQYDFPTQRVLYRMVPAPKGAFSYRDLDRAMNSLHPRKR